MNLHIELEKWEEAFILAEKNKSLESLVRVPYAVFLTKNNRFEEAIEAYKLADRPDLSMKILK
jgi:intraflagellar transport protein 122